MSLNLYVIIAALVIGVLTGGAARSLLKRTETSAILAVGGALMASAVANGMASIGSQALVGLDAFALMHVSYLWGTLGLPVAAAIILFAGRRRLGIATMAVMACVLLLAPLGLYMTHVEPFWLRVDRVRLATETLRSPLKIGVLSDLQTTEIGDYETGAIEDLISQNPDVVLVPGDLYQIEAENWEAKVPEFNNAMKMLTNNVPLVFLVAGNTDSVSGLRTIAAGTSAVVLDNESIDVEIAGNQIRLVGITLYGNEAAAAGAVRSIPTGASRTTDEIDMTILLAHQPDEIRRITETPVDLVVAGHTHGGQIALPFFGPPLTLSSVPRAVGAGGLNELDGSPIYVSTGVGRERHNAPQMRLGVRPSIGIIDVTPAR